MAPERALARIVVVGGEALVEVVDLVGAVELDERDDVAGDELLRPLEDGHGQSLGDVGRSRGLDEVEQPT